MSIPSEVMSLCIPFIVPLEHSNCLATESRFRRKRKIRHLLFDINVAKLQLENFYLQSLEIFHKN